MNLSLRAKLILIVGATAAALALVIAVGVQLALQQNQGLADLEQRLVPKLELEPRLQAQFERLGQGLKDAVAAQDRAALEATGQLLDSMFELIAQAGGALEPSQVLQLREAIAAYHRLALSVSSRLLDGEAGEDVVDAITAMQVQHERTTALIDRVARLDRGTLKSGFETLRASSKAAGQYGLGIALSSLALVIGLSIWLGRGAFRSLEEIAAGFARFAKGSFEQPIVIASNDELGSLGREANRMASALEHLGQRRDASDWVRAGQVALAERLRGELELSDAARAAVSFLAQRLDAVAGALYLGASDGTLELTGAYAPSEQAGRAPVARFGPGEGLLGEAALSGELTVIEHIPDDYLQVRSGLGASVARTLILLPLSREGRSIGVLELALFKPCSDTVREFLQLVGNTLAVTFESAKSRARLRELLEESQSLATRLSVQEEELRQNNNELSTQQEELRQANDELEAQRSALRTRNAELEQVRISLQEKANELLKVSSYKSQFLANMSHELRTPLNSMLILSQLLADNDAGNLSPKQVEHTRTIYSAGKGLLALINQVLDLSKIEAGKQDLDASDVVIAEVAEHMRTTFEPQFANRGLTFLVDISPDLPKVIVIDGPCLERILINLLGNALKFTERGSITLRVQRPPPGTHFPRGDMPLASTVAFSVCDTGVGISTAAMERIFARFEQADTRTARRYGGTGLGLAIARESALLMGGDLQLESVEGQGSTFTCFVPERAKGTVAEAKPDGRGRKEAEPPAQVADDRNQLAPDEPHLLIVEDDPVFANHLLSVVHGLRLKAIVALNGQDGLELARTRTPVGIVLDVKLPDTDGFAVREQLRQQPETASIPVHFVSAINAPQNALGLGAVGYLTKPATPDALVEAIQTLIRAQSLATSRVLIIEDDVDQSESLVELLRQSQLETRQARTAAEAVHALESDRFDCVILDLGLPDTDGLRLLEELEKRSDIFLPPVVVHTARALSREETRKIRDYAETVVLKDGRSGERLVDEVRLFVGKLRDRLPRRAPPAPDFSVGRDLALQGVKILIADDDMRTVYALSALLRGKGAEVVVAETGREALRALEEHSNVRIVLMDIMMPDMDGYEAMRRLRRQPHLAHLPVVALTAKAMKGERERCQEAGASDYMAKPVDPNGLLSMLRTWLSSDAVA